MPLRILGPADDPSLEIPIRELRRVTNLYRKGGLRAVLNSPVGGYHLTVEEFGYDDTVEGVDRVLSLDGYALPSGDPAPFCTLMDEAQLSWGRIICRPFSDVAAELAERFPDDEATEDGLDAGKPEAALGSSSEETAARILLTYECAPSAGERTANPAVPA